MVDQFAGFHSGEVAGVPVLWKRDPRFKTFRFALKIRRPLDETAAARSLLPALLLQGTEVDTDRPALARRMESLYGAAVMPSTSKAGETHFLHFSLDSIAGSHAPGNPDLLSGGLALLADLLARPRLVDGAFPEAVFERERTQAAHAARGLYNDKMSYAAERAIACTCAGEPFAIPEYGGIEAIDALTIDAPEAARHDFLGRGEMWALAMGALPEDGLLERIGEFLAELPERDPEAIGPPVQPARREPRSTVERVEVQQSKQVLTFRLPWTEDPQVWMARGMFASMLGGGPHSRLFKEVREKHSLAYYAHAVVDRHKSLLQIHVGLDESAAEKAQAEVMRQIEELCAGRFAASELDTARAGALSQLASIDDSIGERMEFTSRQWQQGLNRTPEDVARAYMALTTEQVANAMDGMWLDHGYLLAPLAGAEVQG